MKLKYEISFFEIDDCPMAVPVGAQDNHNFVMHMNEITTDILKILEKEVTEDDVVTALKKEYDATEETIRISVRKVVDILRQNNMLSE